MNYTRRWHRFRSHVRATSPWVVGSALSLLACGVANFGIAMAARSLPEPLPFVLRTLVFGSAMAALAGLALRARRMAVQRRRDEEAAQTLDLLRLEGLQSGSALLEIHAVQWATTSGQRVWAVDVLTGAVIDHWLPGPEHPIGSLVLVRQTAGRPPNIEARMSSTALKAAHRHQRTVVDSAPSPAGMVVEAAERILRG